MGALAQTLGGLGRPLVLGLVILLGLGLVSDNSGKGTTASGGLSCKGWTNDPELNRLICRYHPARIWNMPVSEMLPFLAPKAEEMAAAEK
ncbi:hypothetical protein [Aliiruegeria sabulilitoris]|uniref:hypothetical protein n=1 Tax=Aliiruegeria sabulilitoris TaxID=1510458 RepID=UPI00082F9B88|nr:hypothetical protein [Aliiruegeria sabulilitoris]NDR57757.1 hypothetical protein [Pseudoruegeria sp. M32A2M]